VVRMVDAALPVALPLGIGTTLVLLIRRARARTR
jgi:hypothetical protein